MSVAEQKLLDFVGILTLHASQIDDDTVAGLREVGWADPQIAEAVYIGSFFNMLVRIADAFQAMPPPVTDVDGIPRALAPPA